MLDTSSRLFLGLEVSEEEMKEITYPLMEVMGHVTSKTLQLGVLGGTVYGHLLAAVRRSTRNQDAMIILTQRYAVRAGAAGLAAGPLVTWLYCEAYKKLNENDMYDRSYRLRHNRGQLRIDRAFQGGMLVGGVTSLFGGSGIFYGAAVGSCAGLLTMSLLEKKGIFDV